MTSTLQTVKALDERSQAVELDSQSDLQWLIQNFDLILSMGYALLQDLEKLTDDKDIKRFIKGRGGKKFVEPYTQIASWYRSLSKEWCDKIRCLPFWNIEKNQWAKLAQLTLEQLEEWYEEIIELSEALFLKNGTKLLSPRVLNQTVSKFLPKSPKKTLPLGKLLEDEDYEVLRNIPEYDFTEDSFEAFKSEVVELVDEEPVTEDLFSPLEKRGFEPKLILSKTDCLVLKHQKELDKKDEQINTLTEKSDQQEQLLTQHQQLIEQLTERLTKLEQERTPVNPLV